MPLSFTINQSINQPLPPINCCTCSSLIIDLCATSLRSANSLSSSLYGGAICNKLIKNWIIIYEIRQQLLLRVIGGYRGEASRRPHPSKNKNKTNCFPFFWETSVWNQEKSTHHFRIRTKIKNRWSLTQYITHYFHCSSAT